MASVGNISDLYFARLLVENRECLDLPVDTVLWPLFINNVGIFIYSHMKQTNVA